MTFSVTLNKSDSNNEVIPNSALYSSTGASTCGTSAPCRTNTVTVKVVGLPKAVPMATAPHTGEPWAGSRPYEIAILAVGAGLIAIGERARHRMRKRTRRA